MKKVFSFLMLFLVPLTVLSHPQNRAGKAAIRHPGLLIFTGSDWCPNCRRLEKKILDDTLFISFVRGRITVELADFPQHKKLEPSAADRNIALAEKYQFRGVYPTILLLDSAGNILSEIRYRNQNAVEFIDQLKGLLIQKKQ